MSDLRVETIARLAQWRVDSMSSSSYKRSDTFKMGIWNWHLSVERNRYLYVRLFPEPNKSTREQPPVVSFVLRLYIASTISRRPLSFTVQDRLLRSSEDFHWPVETTVHGRFIIEVEFHGIKVTSPNGTGHVSVLPNEGDMSIQAKNGALTCLSLMLDEGLHSDVTIHTPNGMLKAHWAILAARSKKFEIIYRHGEASSSIDIDDLSMGACRALLSYMYGCIKCEEFEDHRIDLLKASEKFCIEDLKDACEDSLMEDLHCKNVLERLQQACIYQLVRLKKSCFKYLFDFGKIYDLREELAPFFENADKELMIEMFQEVLNVSRGG